MMSRSVGQLIGCVTDPLSPARAMQRSNTVPCYLRTSAHVIHCRERKFEIERLDLDVLVAVLAICLYLPGCHCIIHSEVSFAASRSTDQHYACAAATNSNFARVSHGEKRKFSRECTYIYEYMRMYILYLLHIINYRHFALPRKNDQRNVFSNR